jgi:TRAP-type C4-dicarboxylate transport system permease large subunit
MTAAALLLGVAAFVVAIRYSLAPDAGAEALATVRSAIRAMADRTLSDDEKERFFRRASLRLFADFFRISLSGVFALTVPAVILWAGIVAGLFSPEDVARTALSWPFLLGSGTGSVIAWLALKRLT